MIVICIEGCHGCGKTELSKQFQDAGFWVLDEAFLDMPEYALHPQSLLMETTWVCCWFERLLRRADECKSAGVPHEQQVFIADRSPFSAVFYAQNGKGKLLEPIIREHVRELREEAQIEIYTVYLQVEKEILWARIQERLAREPHREKYNEGDRAWMEKTLGFYEGFEWDATVANNQDNAIASVMDGVVSTIAGRSALFRRAVSEAEEAAGAAVAAEEEEVKALAEAAVATPPPAGGKATKTQSKLAALGMEANGSPSDPAEFQPDREVSPVAR